MQAIQGFQTLAYYKEHNDHTHKYGTAKKRLRFLASVIFLFMCFACSTLSVHAAVDDFTRINGDVAEVTYSLFAPSDWNGDLVLLVHGSILGRFEALAQELLAQGFGVAFAILPPTVGEGAALKKVTLTTRIIQDQFVHHFGQPNQVYLFSLSRGGHVTTNLVETSPHRYAGVFSVCGGNGGSQLQWDYFFTARILFDYYFPGVLPGDSLHMPPLTVSEYFAQVFPTAVQAVFDNPVAAEEMANVAQYNLQYNDLGELASGIASSLLVHSIGVNDLLQAAHGNPFDNSSTAYTGSSDDDALNAGVARLTMEPPAVNYLQTWYEPDGSIDKTPMLVLHTNRDSLTPERLNNDKYEALVTSTNNGDFFVRRVIERFGHCAFSNEELINHFADLVSWVETGVRPTP